MAFSLLLSAGQHWEGSFWWEAESWDDMWRLVEQMHEAGPVSVRVGGTRDRLISADIDDVPFFMCGVIDGVWIYRHGFLDGMDTLMVYGADLPVVYDMVFLREVQVQFGSDDPDPDPPLVTYWLPRDLILSTDEANHVAQRMATGEAVPFTEVWFEPKTMNYG